MSETLIFFLSSLAVAFALLLLCLALLLSVFCGQFARLVVTHERAPFIDTLGTHLERTSSRFWNQVTGHFPVVPSRVVPFQVTPYLLVRILTRLIFCGSSKITVSVTPNITPVPPPTPDRAYVGPAYPALLVVGLHVPSVPSAKVRHMKHVADAAWSGVLGGC